MIRILSILGLVLSICNFAQAQTPSNNPSNAPIVQASNTPGSAIGNIISLCCSSYTNFLGTNPTCGVAQTNRDAWFQINGMTAGEQYNFLYIETGNRQTWIEIFELPSGKDKTVPANFKTVKCARANNVAFYPGSTVSATFVPPNAGSTYYVRFQRLNVTDESLEGNFQVTKSYPNEEPCGATLLQVQPAQGTNPTFGNNTTAADWKPDILTGPLCGPNNDVWYKFVATACSMQIFVDNLSQNVYEMQAAILASPNGDCNNLMDVTPCGGQPDQYLDIMLTADNLTIGKTYYVIVDGYSPPYVNAIGNFSIEVFKKPNGPVCPSIASPCDCSDALTCGGTVLPNSAAGNAALNAATANPLGNGCYSFAANGPAPALCGGNNTVEFCSKYTALSSDTLIAFDNIVGKDPTCEVLSTKNIAYEEGLCAAPIDAVCLDLNKKTPVFRVTPGKTYRFCRQIITNGSDVDCLGKTYQSYCGFLWKVPVNYPMLKTVCNGESVKIGNTTYNTTGIYTTTLSASTGCDSIITLNLTVLPAKSNSITTSICNGDSYTLGNDKFNKTGTYTSVVKAPNGCDSTVTLVLTVLPANIVNVSKTICFGEKITIGTSTFDKTGVYTASVKTNGLKCDSTVNLTLTVLSKNNKIDKKVVCNGASVTSNGTVYDKTGKYDQKYKGKDGCDSTYTLDLTVLPILKKDVNASICDGTSYTIAGQTFDKPGTYPIVVKTKLGCDSTITLTLKISNKVETTLTKTICEGDKIVFGGLTYDKTGIYPKTYNNPGGCDSTATLNLTVTPVLTSNITETLCYGKTKVINGKIYSQTTKEDIKIKNSKGCDSLKITLNLTILDENKAVYTGSTCQAIDDSIKVNVKGKMISVPAKVGTYPIGGSKDKNQCDSTAVIVITAESVTPATGIAEIFDCNQKVGAYNITSPTGAEYAYKWSSPNGNGTKLSNAPAGTYTVTISSSKSACVQVLTTTLAPRAFDVKTVSTASTCAGSASGSVAIITPKGAKSYDWSLNANVKDKITETAKNLQKGTYSVTVTEADGCTGVGTDEVKEGAGITANIAENNVKIYLGETATFTLITTAVNPTITWTPATVTLKSGTTNVYTVKPTTKGENIPYKVTVTDANGCTATAQVVLTTLFLVPSVFTPDGDIDFNKTFTPVKNKDVTSNLVYKTFLVFNRWGEVVYNNAAEHTWNGTFNGKKCPTDVYIYKIEADGIDLQTGEITLLR